MEIYVRPVGITICHDLSHQTWHFDPTVISPVYIICSGHAQNGHLETQKGLATDDPSSKPFVAGGEV